MYVRRTDSGWFPRKFRLVYYSGEQFRWIRWFNSYYPSPFTWFSQIFPATVSILPTRPKHTPILPTFSRWPPRRGRRLASASTQFPYASGWIEFHNRKNIACSWLSYLLILLRSNFIFQSSFYCSNSLKDNMVKGKYIRSAWISCTVLLQFI